MRLRTPRLEVVFFFGVLLKFEGRSIGVFGNHWLKYNIPFLEEDCLLLSTYPHFFLMKLETRFSFFFFFLGGGGGVDRIDVGE